MIFQPLDKANLAKKKKKEKRRQFYDDSRDGTKSSSRTKFRSTYVVVWRQGTKYVVRLKY